MCINLPVTQTLILLDNKKPSDKKREDLKKAERRRIRDEVKKQRALEKRTRKNR